MSTITILLLLGGVGIAGLSAGYFLRWIIALGAKGSMELKVRKMELDAEKKGKDIIEAAEKEAEKDVRAKLEEVKVEEAQLNKDKDRLIQKEEKLEIKQATVDADVEALKKKVEEIREIRSKSEELLNARTEELAKAAKLPVDEAKEQLLKAVERDSQESIVQRMQKLEVAGKEQIERKAQEILTTAIHRIGNAMPADVISTKVELPNDDLKGKIIGKEGRNIKAFEHASGVDVIVDDTPGTITISSFDPIRRQIARTALENLITDGRIQPAKIEKALKKAEEEIGKITKEAGEKAAFDAKVTGLDPRIIAVLGRLHFRTSYGQNVLAHSVEMSILAGLIATEVGADADVARAGALVHDIGKAVDHEVQGTHVEIGRRILQKFGASDAIIKAMEAHHEEYPYSTPESYIVQVADAISGGRPGARRDTIEQYIQRLEDLEAIANRNPGVEKSYAIAAGREVRVFVNPKEVDDLEAYKLARDIAKEIEKEMAYPGEIKINVIRETRSIEYAR
ncbi:MAG: ribonuclease Y [Candidatus Pacebacteria bacterium]|nr:ribonuclease Y [Candidatus Paceibacterota bacterium]